MDFSHRHRMHERILTLYGTLGCHLCDQAEALVAPVAMRLGYRVRNVDIAEDASVPAEFEVRIPVLEHDGRRLFWPFDEAGLYRFLL
jgi:hypothetical protein